MKMVRGTRIKFKFIDSFRFLNASLENLAASLSELPLLKSEFLSATDEEYAPLCRNGVFPYDYVTDYNILERDAIT